MSPSSNASPSDPTAPDRRAASWERPAFEVVCLACEISAYAPDEGEPLF
jgi:hypothetical protein